MSNEEARARLLALRAEIMGDSSMMANEALSGDSKEGTGNLSSVPQHMADKGSDTYEQSFTLSRLENATNVVTEIDEALERLDNGTYGRCAECGGEVGERRLKARPYAALCVQCKQKLEEENGS